LIAWFHLDLSRKHFYRRHISDISSYWDWYHSSALAYKTGSHNCTFLLQTTDYGQAGTMLLAQLCIYM